MKKLLIFLMVAIPLVIIIIVNLTVTTVVGYVSIAVDNVILNESRIEGNVDDKFFIKATIYPESATNKDIIWESTNEDVAKVDIGGNVTFIGFGSGHIIATTVDGNKKASCTFFVDDVRVHEIDFFAPKTEIEVGEELQLRATVIPTGAINKNMIYESFNPDIVRIDSNGVIYGLKLGSATIKVASEENSDVSSVITIAVIKPVESLVLQNEEVVVSQSFHRISYNIYPLDASIRDVIFEVDKPEIATVNGTGLVSFLQAGSVNIKLTTVNGGFSETVKVVFTDGYAADLTLSETFINAKVGDTPKYIDYSVKPSYIYATEISFSSDNPLVASVDDNGEIQFVGGGGTLIRARIESSHGKYIEKTISVFVEMPASGIILEEEIITALKTIKLQPKSYPNNSTNSNFYFCSQNTDIATVLSDGTVEFLVDDMAEVLIDVSANADTSDRVHVLTKVKYTAGLASSFDIKNTKLEVVYGTANKIEPVIYPANANSDVVYEVISQTENAGSGEVLRILEDGTIVALGGGKATVKAKLLTLMGVSEITIDITVIRPVENIEISLPLEYVSSEYITGLATVEFSAICLPQDSTNLELEYYVSDRNVALINGNYLQFKTQGVVTLYAASKDGNCVKSVNVRWTGHYPISATINAIPKTLLVGEAFSVSVESTYPSNVINKAIKLKVTNQITLSKNGEVLIVDGCNVYAVSGGTATLIVSISSTVQLTYQIEVIRISEEISVSPNNITTTKSSISLSSVVLPEDTTNKTVIFTVLNEDIATVNGNTLTFKQNGIAYITAVCEDNPLVLYSFYIEKIDKSAGSVDPTSGNIQLLVGDTAKLDLGEHSDFEISAETPVFAGNKVIQVSEGGIITALNLGTANIEVFKFDENGVLLERLNIEVNVVCLAEEIVFASDIDYFNGEYITAANSVDLQFNILPVITTNKDVNISIHNSFTNSGLYDAGICYLRDKTIYFNKVGTVVLSIVSADENASSYVRIKYTGGDAVSAQLNIESNITMNVGERVEIKVLSWLPKDTENTNIYVSKIGVSKAVEIENKTTLVAAYGGNAKIQVELSNGIIKEINVTVAKKVESIVLEKENIITAQSEVSLYASVLPLEATNKNLSYTLQPTELAIISGNVITFVNAGTVYVTISAMDGSNVQKICTITSTMGYLESFQLNLSQKVGVKGSTFNLYVLEKLPSDASLGLQFYYRVVNMQTNDNSDFEVVSVNDSGIVKLLYGGRATIMVYTYNYYGEEIFAECNIEVMSFVTSFDVAFNENVEYSQGSIITSKDRYYFTNNILPVDASNKNVIYVVENPAVAKIDNGAITFLKEGRTFIKFISEDTTNGEKSVIYYFYYTGQKLISAEIDTSAFSNSVLNLYAGDVFEINVTKYLPSDISALNITIQNKFENRNDQSKQVVGFENGCILALNGGYADFDIYVNNIKVGSFRVNVTRDCTDIEIVEGLKHYTAGEDYVIIAKALPSDAQDKELTFVSENTSVATITSSGTIKFKKFGVVEITVTLISNPNIKKLVTVEYTKDINEIYFNSTSEFMYIGESIDLFVNSKPLDAEDYSIEFSISNSLATMVIKPGEKNKARIIAGDRAGTVTVTARVVGKAITVSRTFTIMQIIKDIELSLDNVNDELGIGGYRVFGNETITSSKTYIKTYQLSIKNINPAGTPLTDLKWSSSDEKVATVNQTGLVTFISVGKATITVAPKKQYSETYPLYDSYTFQIVEGVNVNNFEGLVFVANAKKSIVLLNDIDTTNKTDAKSFALQKNLYGNGYMLNLSGINGNKIFVKASDVLIDNIIIRGNNFVTNAALSELEGKGTCVMISENTQYKNVVIKNSIIENGMSLIQVKDSHVKIVGCILRNSFSSGILIKHEKDSTTPPVVTVQDSVFGRSLLTSILFENDKSKDTQTYKSKLIVQGFIKMYNWIKLDEFRGSDIDAYLPEVFNKVKDFLSVNAAAYRVSHNGEDYYMLGIASVFAGSELGNLSFSSNGIVDISKIDANCNLQYAEISGTIPVYGIPVKFAVKLYGYTNVNPLTRPGESFGDTATILAIRQPFN